MSKLQHALALADRGFWVFQVAPDSKVPFPGSNGHKDATRDREAIERAWTENQTANIGVHAGRFQDVAMLVIDLDEKPGISGRIEFEKLARTHRATVPTTLTATTPSGGLHLYLLNLSSGQVRNSASKLAPGVDVRGDNGYVLAPGSSLNGGEYRWSNPSATIAAAPAWLLGLIGHEPKKADAPSVPPAAINADAARDRAISYLQSAPVAVEGSGGDARTYETAARVKDFGVSEQQCLELMAAHWNENCLPPWPLDELTKKVTNAYHYGDSPIGAAAPELVFSKVESEPSDAKPTAEWMPKPAPKLPPFNPNDSRIGDVFTVAPPAPRFIVEGYLPVACGQENAIGGAGKTTRRMYEGIHIILGRSLYGRPILQPGPVIVVTKEDGADIFKHRLHHVARAMDLSPADQKRVAENFHVLDMTGEVAGRLVCADRQGNLCATDLAERIYLGYRQEGIAQVSFDPWNLFSPGERFVNDAEAALMAAGALVSRELACNVCYVGHVSKAVGRGGIIDAHSGRGGAAMGDNARFVISYVQHDPRTDKEWTAPATAMQAAARGDLARLHITKQSYAKRSLEPIWIERSSYKFIVHEGAPATREESLNTDAERVKLFVRQELASGTRYSARSLAEQNDQYGLSRNRARAVISRLQAKGELVERPLPTSEIRHGGSRRYLDPVFSESAMETSAPAGELFQ